METKQLILEKHCGKVSVIYRINAYAAMQEYAEHYHASQTEMPCDLAKKILDARDALIVGDMHEAYHQLCIMADPELCNLDHWEKLQDIVSQSQLKGGK